MSHGCNRNTSTDFKNKRINFKTPANKSTTSVFQNEDGTYLRFDERFFGSNGSAASFGTPIEFQISKYFLQPALKAQVLRLKRHKNNVSKRLFH